MDALRTFDAEVEVAGWDEAFLAITTDEPETFAKRIQERVLERTRLWCTMGSGTTACRPSSRAGSASRAACSCSPRTDGTSPCAGLATTELWGIGSKTAAKLAELGIRTVGQLAAADEGVLAERFGPVDGAVAREPRTQ